ncbi:MAG: malate synthase A [Acidobacteria bacterium]|nr:MAG: malate synthase A [Acidobacteriota bacterium]MCE7959267.1 malate synthase A [Acidobacteria bacterium ACB2]
MFALTAEGIELLGPVRPGFEEVLTPEALRFVAGLQRAFGARRKELLARRVETQARLDAGELPDFLAETAEVRAAGWKVAPIPADLLDRRVEITGPVDRKMVINALNSGASVFMADFEDANTPTWENQVQGQVNLRDAIDRTIAYTAPDTGKEYRLAEKTAVLLVRPRGWHLPEKHLLVDGEPCSGSLFDFGLYFFHDARRLLARGTGPYFYLPKLEHHLEARLWNDVFVKAQADLGLPVGTIRATVLIETVLAAFQMDEILFELKDHSSGLNCGRWDYIFSFIKKFSRKKEFVLPDRSLVTMDKAFLEAYVKLLIKTCHRRGVHAMGGMAAYIPVKTDPEANAAAIAKVEADKLREVKAGHDGTWVAHPGLVPVARAIFDAHMPTPNQLHVLREEVTVGREDLLRVPEGDVTEKGLRHNINVGILYLESWLRGTGCVPLYNLMEDAATAEISRSQVWQWVHHGARLADGRALTKELYRTVFEEEVARIAASAPPGSRHERAARLFDEMVVSETFRDFLTLPAYEAVLSEERAGEV